MDSIDLINNVTPEIYSKLLQLSETGKWFDGKPMSEHQHDTIQQAVMAYQSKVEKSTSHMSIGANGEIVHQSKSQLKNQFKKQQDILRVNPNDL